MWVFIIQPHHPSDFRTERAFSNSVFRVQNTNGCAIINLTDYNIYGQDPKLGPLADNGGPTWAHALLPCSPAIDQGNSDSLTTDQRGLPRPYDAPLTANAGDGSDIGAYEWTPALAVHCQGDCKVRIEFSASQGRVCFIEASTNLVDWEEIGMAIESTPGAFEFEDPNTSLMPMRFYRIFAP